MGEWLTIWTAFPVLSGFSFTEGFTEICKIINVGTNLEMSYAMYNTKDQIRRLISWSGIISVSLRILQDPIQIFFYSARSWLLPLVYVFGICVLSFDWCKGNLLIFSKFCSVICNIQERLPMNLCLPYSCFDPFSKWNKY